ncbi:Inositol-pentakisphosphate 2-kinase [Babesia duncani]|uniref:Inositol-pentakisphosphate 2-kinase n=1 Tax=Babesia duncani TaxID=323732 RepID=A0AAD9PJB9_9APIC|nr:Inositol-pentakisphosphate 2-kinase [Babesia duncani]
MILIPLGAGNCQFVYRIIHTEDDGDKVLIKDERLNHYVLKISRHLHADDVLGKMTFHDEFASLMKAGKGGLSVPCTPNRMACLVNKNVACFLRCHLYKLLEIDQESSHLDSSRKCIAESQVIIKTIIHHDRETVQKTSIKVNAHAIASCDDLNNYDSQKYELGILEQDLFSLEFITALGAPILNGSISLYKDFSLEFKLKCGLLHFYQFPSMFKMHQPFKSRIRYKGVVDSSIPHLDAPCESNYEPCKFFRLDLPSIKQELINMATVPQNNIRAFIGSLEVDPIILRNNPRLLHLVAICMQKQSRALVRILKLQALASGQQFLAFAILRLVEAIDTSLFKLKRVPVKYNNKVGLLKNLNHLDPNLCKQMLDENTENVHRIQHLFFYNGRKILCRLACLVSGIFDTLDNDRRSLSIERIAKRYLNPSSLLVVTSLGSRQLCSNISHEAKSFQEPPKLLTFEQIPKFKGPLKLKRTNAKLVDELKRTIKVAEYWLKLYLTGRTAMDLSIILNILYDPQELENAYIYHNNKIGSINGSFNTKSTFVPLIHRLSLIDLDLKPRRRIPRWKDDAWYLLSHYASNNNVNHGAF